MVVTITHSNSISLETASFDKIIELFAGIFFGQRNRELINNQGRNNEKAFYFFGVSGCRIFNL